MCLQCRSSHVAAVQNGKARRKKPGLWAGCIGPVVTWKGIVVMGVEGGTRRVHVDPDKLPERIRTMDGGHTVPIDLNVWQDGAGWDRERVKRYQNVIKAFGAR